VRLPYQKFQVDNYWYSALHRNLSPVRSFNSVSWTYHYAFWFQYTMDITAYYITWRKEKHQSCMFVKWLSLQYDRRLYVYGKRTKAIVIITQPVSWYSFYRPTKGGRLSRQKHCNKGAQPVLKTVGHRRSCRDKHNCQRRDSNLGPLTPQSDALTTRLYWDLF